MSKLSEIHSNFKKEIQDCLKECEGACSQHVSNSKCECEKSCLVSLLEELQEYRKLGTVEELKNLIDKEVAERRKAVTEHLLEHSEILKNRWIPCGEKIPAVGVDVLCFDRLGNYMVAQWNEYNSRFEKKDVWVSLSGWYGKNYIIAWQPLPEPYDEK